MSGSSWDERANTDWLASNGRWYPLSKYPSGWSMTSLPPAPEHARAGSILRRVTEQIVVDTQRASDGSGSNGWTSGSIPKRPSASRPQPSARTATSSSRSTGARSSSETSSPAGRADASDRSFLPKEPRRTAGAADAKIVDQGTYKPKIAPGPPAPSALPPPPGRIRDTDEGPRAPDPSLPPPPVVRKAPASKAQTDFEVVAGDLGKVLGVAKRRISRAINEAAEQGR